MSLPLAAGAQNPPASQSQIDAVTVSPDLFTVLLDNDRVRVVRYVLMPGQRDQVHTHPPKVSYVLSGGMLRITTDDGKSFLSEEKAGSAVWMDSLGRHFAENVGKTPVRIVLVEVKSSPLPADSAVKPASASDPVLVNPQTVHTILSNSHVRVLDATLEPGVKERMHSHPACVIYVVRGGKVRTHTADDKARETVLSAGDVLFRDPTTHWSENIGDTTVQLMLVELKN